MSGILSSIFLFDKFGTGDAAFSTCLVQEVDYGTAQGKFIVYLPVQSADQFSPPKVSQRPLK